MVVSECEDMFNLSVGNEPLLIQLHGKKHKQEFMNPYNHCNEERKIPQLEGKLCLGCFGEWLLLADELTKETYFLHINLDPNHTVRLPSLRGRSFEYLGSCVVSASPTSRRCMVTFVGRKRNVILYCRPNMDAKWTKVSLPIGLDHEYRFTGQVVRCKGKIYALRGCGITLAVQVVVINESSLLMGDITWTIIKVPHAIDGCLWRHLVVSGEDIFLVSVAISRYRGIPTYYTIHLLETSDLSWKRVKGIGGCVFFLGGIHSAALPATQAGTQRDCIFVVNLKYGVSPSEGIYRICMRDQTISLSLLLNRPKHKTWYKLCWVLPTRSWRDKHRTLSLSHSIGTNKGYSTYFHKEEEREECCKIDASRPWADLPIELVQLLLPRLYLVDCLRLASICKAWNSLSNPMPKAQVYPWLMYTENDRCLWRLFDPIFRKEYSIDMKWFGFSEDLTFHYSKDGWVLGSKEDGSLFLINPLTREYASLPNLNASCRLKLLAFSSAPTSPDCVVVISEIINSGSILEISTWSPGEEHWSTVSFPDELGNLPCKPVFSRGEFYWYRIGGELLVFNPYQKTRQVLGIEAPIEMVLFRGIVMECHLVDLRGDLMMVFRGRTTDPIRIFKLDQLNMIWRELHDMGNVTIFLDHRETLATSCLEKLCHNQIYISGYISDFSHNDCKSSAFYCFGSTKFYLENCYDLKEPINSIWIELSLTTNKSFRPKQVGEARNETHQTSESFMIEPSLSGEGLITSYTSPILFKDQESVP
ncbi:hypothetical protein LUZ63_000261 [Rhynchospora breviuscula]|uniref:KIB1-4 beta-propeller domain-containing protein n=1 Tax=Rhynchospora breviuscula TaxID=2022672 RepID=A0A9Q0HVW9_9POAL|nr:hypothetical protein LUZ63_000261 [Rhynchospora breviuscula]